MFAFLRAFPNRVEKFQTRIGFPKACHEFDAQMSRSLARIVVHEFKRIKLVKISASTFYHQGTKVFRQDL
jgi:hypothetical protein